jgi:hypothetical protein
MRKSALAKDEFLSAINKGQWQERSALDYVFWLLESGEKEVAFPPVDRERKSFNALRQASEITGGVWDYNTLRREHEIRDGVWSAP